MTTADQIPDLRDRLSMVLESIDATQNHLSAAATLLRFSAGSWVGTDNDEKRARATRLETIAAELETAAEAVQTMRGFGT